MSDKLKNVAIKLDEIESHITELKDNLKNVINYVLNQCCSDEIRSENETTNGEITDD